MNKSQYLYQKISQRSHMQRQINKQGMIVSMSDKDYQLVSKTFRRISQLYYQNPLNQQCLQNLIDLTQLIPMIVPSSGYTSGLTIVSQMEILKAKARSSPELTEKLSKTIEHLKNPRQVPIQEDLLLDIIDQRQLFTVGCLVVLRYYPILEQSHRLDWKQVIAAISEHIVVNPPLSIQILNLISTDEHNNRSISKSGLIKNIFVNHIYSNLKDKYNLYQVLKLIRTVAAVDSRVVRDRENILAEVIHTYEEYIPTIADVFEKCYDAGYCQELISKKDITDEKHIDYGYVWSYTESFCVKQLNQNTMQSLLQALKSPNLTQTFESKALAIFSNYAKHKYLNSASFLTYLPSHQSSLLNYLKLLHNLSQSDPSVPYSIKWTQLDNLLQANSNAKVGLLAKHMKEMMNKDVKVGTIGSNMKKMFEKGENVDLMMEKAGKVPKNQQDTELIKDILAMKERAHGFDADTLKMAKEKAIQSLRQAITRNVQLDLNSILQSFPLNSLQLLSSLLQMIELYLVKFPDAGNTINLKRILEMIQFMEDNYQGEIIDWGSISQLLLMLTEEGQWKRHLKNIEQHCFWILQIQNLQGKDQQALWDALKKGNVSQKKMALAVGFLGKVVRNIQRATMLGKRRNELQAMVSSMAKDQNYELNVMMLSYFLRGWGEQEQSYTPESHKNAFSEFIVPIDTILSSHSRLLPQDYYLLQACLPFKINLKNFNADMLETLLKRNGKLAGYVYGELGGKRTVQRIVGGQGESVQAVHQSMIFARENSNLVKSSEIKPLISQLDKQQTAYWQYYPRYVDIVANLLSILSSSASLQESSLSGFSQTLISQIISNPNMTDDERQELLEEVRNAIDTMRQRGVYLEIQRIRRIVTKIVEKDIREEIIIILNNYKVKEDKKLQMDIIREQEKEEEERLDRKNILPLSHESNKLSTSHVVNEREEELPLDRARQSTMIVVGQTQFREQAFSSSVSLEKQFQSIKSNNTSVTLIEAFEKLKKIVSNELPFAKFDQIYPLFNSQSLSQFQRQLLGSLLAELYLRQNDQRILSFLLNKEKTSVNKQKVLQMVSKQIYAFALSKRWKLVGRQYLDIAMRRVLEGFVTEGCQVVNYNLVKTADLEYFYSQKYHKTITQLIQKASQQEAIVHLLSLIGMAARFPQIRVQWVTSSLHTSIFAFASRYSKNPKITANLCFAQSALTFQQNQACIDIIKLTDHFYALLGSMLLEPGNQSIAQYGSLFLGNLSFAKCWDHNPKVQVKKVVDVLKVIFEANLDKQNLACYKHLLKALGNMSLVPGCSKMILDDSFGRNMSILAQKIDIFSSIDQRKQKYIKLLLDLVSNLSTNKDLERIPLFHTHKLTNLTITILQTVQTCHSQLIASCIDAIDSLCQVHQIQQWYLVQKKLAIILLDILKLQSQEILISKAVRLITNLTLHDHCVQHILKSNILSVIGSVVIPQLHIRGIAQENLEYCKKVENYIFKMITRIYQIQPKPPIQTILKSGFLDCLVRVIQMAQVDQKFLDILFHYSSHIPNFLNKRAFSSMIKILTLKVNDKEILKKCLQSLKNILSFSYDYDQEDNLIKGIPQMYMKFLTTQYTADALFLLAYHLLRSQQFRQLLRKDDKFQHYLKSLASKQQQYTQTVKSIIFLIYSSSSQIYLPELDTPGQTQNRYYQLLRKGFNCLLYRSDGTHKDAIIDVDNQYNFRVYKAPDGEIKKKYVINVKHIREFQVNFQNNVMLWKNTVFGNADKGFFGTHQPEPQHCCTIVGNSQWGQLNTINVEFSSVEDKIQFFKCMSYLLTIFRL